MAEATWEVGTGSHAAHAGFASFYAVHYPGIVKLALSLTGSRWAAEDLAQEAFARALRAWGQVATYDQPVAWVRRVTANLAISGWRRRAAEARALGKLALRRPPEVAPLPAETAYVWREVRALPGRQAQVVALYYVADLSLAEVAETLGIPEGTVKSQLHRARQRLAGRLPHTEVIA